LFAVHSALARVTKVLFDISTADAGAGVCGDGALDPDVAHATRSSPAQMIDPDARTARALALVWSFRGLRDLVRPRVGWCMLSPGRGWRVVKSRPSVMPRRLTVACWND